MQSTWSASGVGTIDGGFAHVDALDVLKVCLRRWYVVLPVVLLSLAAGIGLALQQKPTYTAFGSYALVYHNAATSTELREGRDPTDRIRLLLTARSYSAKHWSPTSCPDHHRRPLVESATAGRLHGRPEMAPRTR